MDVSAIRRAAIALGGSAVVTLGLLALPAASSAVTVTSIAKGLDNPRALTFDSDGHLFVAEAGHGGSECLKGGPGGPEEETCVGFTSGVSKIENGVAHRVADGYASAAGRDGSVAVGIDGVSAVGDWRLFAVDGNSQFIVPPSGLAQATIEKGKAQLGHLFEFTPGHARTVADVGGFDFKWAEEHKSLVPEQFPDANPYAVLAAREGEWVVDAASNTVDWVSDSGKVKVVAFIPNPPKSDAVPTCIAKGSDGALYVGQLTGGGNGPGAAAIWRVEPWDGDVNKWATGLTAITGCGFDTDGDFYAVEFSVLGFESFAPETGALVRVPPHSSKPITVVSKLSFPNGFAARPHQIYLSNWSIAPASGSPMLHGATGEVLRITH
jgi:hypothetical protein